MDAHTIIDLLGGTTETAKLCNITPGAVSQWFHSGIPQARLMFLRLARPDVFVDPPPAQPEATHPPAP